jgi:mitogen-activated protein kinase kinase 5
MLDCPITIRICTAEGAFDWVVSNPDQLTFAQGLEVIRQALPGVAVTAFEYEDEEKDRITVKSYEEMKAMLSFYMGSLMANQAAGLQACPLMIYPKVGKDSGKRNIFGLKVLTKDPPAPAVSRDPMPHCQIPPLPGPGATAVAASAEDMDIDTSTRKRSGDIREILACGTIRQSDLQTLHVLGSGNCGTVFKALNMASNEILAMKVIPLDISREAQQQIISELEILSQCRSPVIISFYGAFFLENRISICAEYMDGGSLDTYGQIEERVLGPISVSIVQGLQYLWSLKIMHRDVKPSNILVNTQGQTKLCDFGVSVQLIDSIAKSFIGTNAYMAPERIKGLDYSINSEVWSLGVSLFEMAAGSFPYESGRVPGCKSIDLWKSIVDKEPPQLPRGTFSDEFVHFVAQCMQKEPMRRPRPEALMGHRFIQQHINSSIETVATWVISKLAARQLQQQQEKQQQQELQQLQQQQEEQQLLQQQDQQLLQLQQQQLQQLQQGQLLQQHQQQQQHTPV